MPSLWLGFEPKTIRTGSFRVPGARCVRK